MRRLLAWLCVAALACGAIGAGGEERADPAREQRSSKEESGADRREERGTQTVYIPPARGSTRTRTGGATRGRTPLPRLAVLAPDHVALTARAAPTLAWYVDGAARLPLVLTLLRDGATAPELEVTLAEAVEEGIAQAELSRWNVALEPGVVYQWSVALVADPARWDESVVASGGIERVSEPAETAPRRAGESRHRALARDGLWYDAIAELGESIAAGDASLRAERAVLLEQVGLDEAAAFDRAAR